MQEAQNIESYSYNNEKSRIRTSRSSSFDDEFEHEVPKFKVCMLILLILIGLYITTCVIFKNVKEVKYGRIYSALKYAAFESNVAIIVVLLEKDEGKAEIVLSKKLKEDILIGETKISALKTVYIYGCIETGEIIIQSSGKVSRKIKSSYWIKFLREHKSKKYDCFKTKFIDIINGVSDKLKEKFPYTGYYFSEDYCSVKDDAKIRTDFCDDVHLYYSSISHTKLLDKLKIVKRLTFFSCIVFYLFAVILFKLMLFLVFGYICIAILIIVVCTLKGWIRGFKYAGGGGAFGGGGSSGGGSGGGFSGGGGSSGGGGASGGW